MSGKTIGFLLLTTFFTLSFFAVTLTENIEKEFPFKEGDKLTIENINGSIVVEEWDRYIARIEVTKTSKSSTNSDAKEAMDEVKVEFKTVPNGVSVNVSSKRSFSFFSWIWGKSSNVEVSFNIKVPKMAKLVLNSINGSINVSVRNSFVTAESVNGKISVVNSQLLTATTVNGKIDFDSEEITRIESVNGEIVGKIQSLNPRTSSIEAVNGDISLTLKERVKVSLSLENVNGTISCQFKEVEGSKREKSGDINGGGENIKIETVNGSIEVLAF